MGDHAEMLDTARRINDDEVVFMRSPNVLELRYELPQVSAMAARATAREVVFVRSPNFLEPRYEPPQGSAMHFLRDRIMIGQLVYLLEIAIELNS